MAAALGSAGISAPDNRRVLDKEDNWLAVIIRVGDGQSASVAGPVAVLNPLVAVLAGETHDAIDGAPVHTLWLAASPADAGMEALYIARVDRLLSAEAAAPDGRRYVAAVLHRPGWLRSDFPREPVPTGNAYVPCSPADAAALAELVAGLPQETDSWRAAAIKAVEYQANGDGEQPEWGPPRRNPDDRTEGWWPFNRPKS